MAEMFNRFQRKIDFFGENQCNLNCTLLTNEKKLKDYKTYVL